VVAHPENHPVSWFTMKKVVLIVVALLVIAVGGIFIFRTMSAQNSAGELRTSRRKAESLQAKIDDIKSAETSRSSKPQGKQTEVTEAELESFVLFSLRDKIPVKLDSIAVQLLPGAVSADTQVTFNSNNTGNSIVDSLVGGTHNLFVKGNLSGDERRGKFDLVEVKLDGIPVPRVLIQTLVDKYVKPKYPEVDLREPFDLPWGIRTIAIENGKARIAY